MFKRLTLIMLAMLLVAASLAGCATPDGMVKDSEISDGKKGTVNLAYVNWAEGIAMTNLVAAILEDKIGYDVNMTMADVGPVFTSVANGNSDIFVDVWLPITHEAYISEYGDDMVDYGIVYEDALLALVVPAYVEIDSIEELNDNVDMFGGEIIGIDPGAGLMAAAERAIASYGLDYKLISGSDVTMTAALGKAIENNEPIVVTGWAPHWKFARWDLKTLEDPLGEFGAVENIYKYARKGLDEDMPEVADFLKKFKLTSDELGDLMGAIEDGSGEPLDIARDWMNANEDIINNWF